MLSREKQTNKQTQSFLLLYGGGIMCLDFGIIWVQILALLLLTTVTLDNLIYISEPQLPPPSYGCMG